MAHERISAAADPTFDDAEGVDPGVRIEWHNEIEAACIGTGDLNATVHQDRDTLPQVDITAVLGEARDSDTEKLHEVLTAAIQDTVHHAYTMGLNTPRFVWPDRKGWNKIISVGRRARNAAHGADE